MNVNRQKVNKARMICAIAGGAMDTFNRDRLSLLNSMHSYAMKIPLPKYMPVRIIDFSFPVNLLRWTTRMGEILIDFTSVVIH